jgi:peptide-methionine (S)-S-oxide reductase
MSDTTERAVLAGGCFWGMQDLTRKPPGVRTTRVGYTGGNVPDPTYRKHEGHAEAIEILFDPQRISYRELLEYFFQVHDPTTKDRQGNDIGTSYRSAIFTTTDEQLATAHASRGAFAPVVKRAGHDDITTEIGKLADFYYAEDYHQQYLHKNPGGYCNHGPNGMTCPVGLLRQDELPAQQEVLPPSA